MNNLQGRNRKSNDIQAKNGKVNNIEIGIMDLLECPICIEIINTGEYDQVVEFHCGTVVIYFNIILDEHCQILSHLCKSIYEFQYRIKM